MQLGRTRFILSHVELRPILCWKFDTVVAEAIEICILSSDVDGIFLTTPWLKYYLLKFRIVVHFARHAGA